MFPVVVFLSPGAGGLTRAVYQEVLFGEEVLRFQYACVGLPDLQADEYQELANPLAPASGPVVCTAADAAARAPCRAGAAGRALAEGIVYN